MWEVVDSNHRSGQILRCTLPIYVSLPPMLKNRLAFQPGGCIVLHTRPSCCLMVPQLSITFACHALCSNLSNIT